MRLRRNRGHRRRDPKGRRYLHVLAGLEARDVPEEWRVQLSGDNRMQLRGEGFSATLQASCDQGADISSFGAFGAGGRTTFGGAPALKRTSARHSIYTIFSRRRIIQLVINGGDAELIKRLEQVLAPTFQVPAPAWPEAVEVPEPAASARGQDEKAAPADGK